MSILEGQINALLYIVKVYIIGIWSPILYGKNAITGTCKYHKSGNFRC